MQKIFVAILTGYQRTPGGLATGETIAGLGAPDVTDGEPYRCCGG